MPKPLSPNFLQEKFAHFGPVNPVGSWEHKTLNQFRQSNPMEGNESLRERVASPTTRAGT